MAPTNTGANPFWDFSLDLYAGEGVASACLELQDHAQVDVNLLLYCVWRASRGFAVTMHELQVMEQAIADWREDVVRPVRRLRRQLKGIAGVESCRELIQTAEELASAKSVLVTTGR